MLQFGSPVLRRGRARSRDCWCEHVCSAYGSCVGWTSGSSSRWTPTFGYAGTVQTSAGSHCQPSSNVRKPYWVPGLRVRGAQGGRLGPPLEVVRICRVLSHSTIGPSKTAAHTSAVFLSTVPHQISSKVDYWLATLTPVGRSGCRMEYFPITLQSGRDCPPICRALNLYTQPLVAILWTWLLALALFCLFRVSL